MDDAALRPAVDQSFEVFERDVALAAEPEAAGPAVEAEVADLVASVALLEPLVEVVLQFGHGGDVAADALELADDLEGAQHRFDAPRVTQVRFPVPFEGEHTRCERFGGGITSGCGGGRA
ncbi:MAG: hypothetical protein OXH86_13630 [Acidimicrobiaceae bacterium]|nr:hypothetical protein [Acidimicrobiaceae bacterium]